MDPYLYQQTILGSTVRGNCLVVLPTGMGKTLIAILTAKQRKKQYPNSKIVMMAPTKPLAEQQMRAFQEHINEGNFVLFTGSVPPAQREELWKTNDFVFTTPQGLENDIMGGRIDIKDVSLMVFDEAHRAVGNYSYVFIANAYHKKGTYSRILGLTASPGSDMETISEVMDNLHIEEVEIRTPEDPDVKPYVNEIDVKWIKVDLPEEFLTVKNVLDKCQKSKLEEVKNLGYLNTIDVSKTELLKLQGQMHGMLSRGERDFNMMKSLSLLAEAMKVAHALELLESQGIIQLKSYLEQLEGEARKSSVKATKNLVRDLQFRIALEKTRDLVTSDIQHPKIPALKELLSSLKKEDSKFIVFTQFRNSASLIVDMLNQDEDLNARLFVGQAKKNGNGLSQKKQIEMLNEFRLGLFNVLVATSVAEEGLDIPSVDTVIFYEPVPSAIRHIQRRGRTGRGEKGQTYILLAKNTRDEGYRWAAHHKEKRMVRLLNEIRNKVKFQLNTKKQPTLDEFSSPKPQKTVLIVADTREKGNPALREMANSDATIKLQQLQSGDYLLSSRVGVEFKTTEDFLQSLVDGRLLEQMKNLKSNFEKPILIIEGDQDIYSLRKVHPNAISGMLSAIAVDFQIPIVQTKDAQETSRFMLTVARREQEFKNSSINIHGDRKGKSISDQQEYVISSIPSVGPIVAKKLLEKFGNIRNVMNASIELLKEVEMVGDKKAIEIRKFLDKEYSTYSQDAQSFPQEEDALKTTL